LRTKLFQTPDALEITVAPGPQDDNKNTYEANILCILTVKLFQKHTFFVKNVCDHHRSNVASPNCSRP